MKNKTIQGCDWCGERILNEPYKNKKTAKQGQWEKTIRHAECRKKEKTAYKD